MPQKNQAFTLRRKSAAVHDLPVTTPSSLVSVLSKNSSIPNDGRLQWNDLFTTKA
jgi:hypothetical protein